MIILYNIIFNLHVKWLEANTIYSTPASEIQLGARKNASLYHMSSPLEQAKLAVLSGLSSIGLSDAVAANKLDSIYAYNIVEQLP